MNTTHSITLYTLLLNPNGQYIVTEGFLQANTHTIPVTLPPTKCLFYLTTFSIKKTGKRHELYTSIAAFSTQHECILILLHVRHMCKCMNMHETSKKACELHVHVHVSA